MPISFDHEALQSTLNHLKDALTGQYDNTAGDVIPSDGVDPGVVAAAHDDDAGTLQGIDALLQDTDQTETARSQVQALDEESAHRMDSVDTQLSQGQTAGSGAGFAPASTGAASSAPTQAAQMPMQQAYAQQAQQAYAQQAAQQQAAQQQAQYQNYVNQYNQQQMQAWQQAMAQRQAAINQLNAQAQQQATQQVAADPDIDREEIMRIIDGLYDDEDNHIDTSDRPAASLPVSDTDSLDVGAVSFEKVAESTLSEAEVEDVINQACDLNGVTDDPQVRQQFINTWRLMALNESGFNPNAANGWDSNAVGEVQSDGYPAQSSRGMWQCIPGTFAANHVAGTSESIYDPLASCAASIHYVMDRYGVGPDGSGLGEFASQRGIDPNDGGMSSSYVGY